MNIKVEQFAGGIARARLNARIKAQNAANEYANFLHPKLSSFFTSFVGQKVLTANGVLLKKIVDNLFEMPCSPSLHVYKNPSTYRLAWDVRTCVNENNISYYAEVNVQVGFLKNGVLENLTPDYQRRTDFSVEEIEQKREIYRTAKKLADNAFSDLYPFGEHDH